MNTATWPAGAGGLQDAAPRLFDAAGADDCVDVLVNRRSSLLLCSDDGAVLDRQAQMLMRNLRDVADVETAVLLEIDRGLLLERFNRLLSEFTVEQARQRVPTSLRVWILHVHSAAELSQARLLLRLCQDFSAAGVALAMLGPISVGRELAPEGSSRRLQVRVLTDFWSEMSRAAGPPGRTDPPLGPAPQEAGSAVQPPPPPAPPPPSARSGSPSRAPWIGLGLLLACAGAVMWVQSRGGLDLLRGPSQSAQSVVAMAEPSAVPGAAAAAAAAATQAQAQPSTSADPSPGGRTGDAVSGPSVAAAGAVEVAAIRPVTVLPSIASGPTASGPGGSPAATPVSNAGTPAPATSDRPGVQPGKALPPPAAAPSTPGEEIASSVRWVRSQPPSAWLVQHRIDSDVGRLLDLRSNYPRLSESRVLAVLRADGRLYYALVSGPFENVDEARGFIRDGAQEMPNQPWVRSIASLSRELDDRRRGQPGAAASN